MTIQTYNDCTVQSIEVGAHTVICENKQKKHAAGLDEPIKIGSLSTNFKDLIKGKVKVKLQEVNANHNLLFHFIT